MSISIETRRPDRANEWSKSLEKCSANEFVNFLHVELGKTKAQCRERVASLRLPQLPFFTGTVAKCLESFSEIPQRLGAGPWSWTIEKIPQASKREIGMPNELALLLASISQEPSAIVTIRPQVEVLYEGNILITRSGRLIAEFNTGSIPPSRERVSAPYRVQQNEYTNTLNYNFDDQKLRAALRSAIFRLPRLTGHQDRIFLPGYYEVSLIGDALYPSFHDAWPDIPF